MLLRTCLHTHLCRTLKYKQVFPSQQEAVAYDVRSKLDQQLAFRVCASSTLKERN